MALRISSDFRIFGFRDFLEKLDVNFIKTNWSVWEEECERVKREFFFKFETYKERYFAKTDTPKNSNHTF